MIKPFKEDPETLPESRSVEWGGGTDGYLSLSDFQWDNSKVISTWVCRSVKSCATVEGEADGCRPMCQGNSVPCCNLAPRLKFIILQHCNIHFHGLLGATFSETKPDRRSPWRIFKVALWAIWQIALLNTRHRARAVFQKAPWAQVTAWDTRVQSGLKGVTLPTAPALY